MREIEDEILRYEQQQKLQEAQKNAVLLEAFLDEDIFIDHEMLFTLNRGHLRFGVEIAILGLKKDLGLLQYPGG